MLKKGLCGGDLKQQVTVIALTYCVRNDLALSSASDSKLWFIDMLFIGVINSNDMCWISSVFTSA